MLFRIQWFAIKVNLICRKSHTTHHNVSKINFIGENNMSREIDELTMTSLVSSQCHPRSAQH